MSQDQSFVGKSLVLRKWLGEPQKLGQVGSQGITRIAGTAVLGRLM